MPVARLDGSPAVLKVQWPDRESEHEANALAAWGGNGAVRLIDYDAERRALLIERCEPGTPLSAENPNLAMEILIGLLPRLWIPAPAAIPSLSDEVTRWFQSLPRRWQRAGRPIERRLVDAALESMHSLVSTQGDQVLVHQDLHADNVLRAKREPWLAIDPKGLIGEPAYETGSLLRNPRLQLLQMPYPARILARRIDQLAEELDVDHARIRNWGLAQAVLSAWWSVEDSGSVGKFSLACAELLAAIKA